MAERGKSPRHVNWHVLFQIIKNIPRSEIIKATKDGCLFDYDYASTSKSDRSALQVHEQTLLHALQVNPKGFWKKSDVDHAIRRLDKNHDVDLSHRIDVKGQSPNWVHYLSDIRAIKKSMTTGIRLPEHTRRLVAAMELGRLFS